MLNLNPKISIIKMRRKLYFKLKKSLYAFVVLLVCLIAQDNHLLARQVSGNIVQAHNSSLPSLTERNGVNSRYLSAASTASLAAATVAAANGGLPSSQSQNNNNNQDATRNFLLHQQPQQQQQLQQQQQQLQQQQNQQQQQQQQQQVSAVLSSGQVNNQPVISPQTQAQPQQQQSSSNGGSIQTPQFNTVQPQQVPNTPIMSTTFTFNPITGQFVPSDLSTGTVITGPTLPQSSVAYSQQPQVFGGFLNQQFSGPQQIPFPFNQYSQNQLRQSYHHQQQQQQQQQPLSSQLGAFGSQFGVNTLNQQRQFSRRQGNTSPQRFSNNNYNQQQQQPIEDDSGFFQQQVANSGGLLSGIIGGDSINGNNFGPEYGNLPGNSYLSGIANQHHLSNQQQPSYQDHQISSQSSSSTPVILPTSTSFSTAFSGPPPSGLEYKNDQCVAADNRHGTCYQASECIKKGGTPMGKCGASSSVNPDFSGSTSYVCCLFDVTCGQFAAERFVYFRNPNYPNTYDQTRMCRAKIGKLDKGVCQFRLDLLRFDIAKPTNGNCSTDMFVVSGQNENYVIPKICGLNDGQHYYVGVDESGVITLHMMMMGFYRRSFEILITQIPCRSDYSAPAHCLQYYMGTHGTIKSFNYDDETNQQQQQQLVSSSSVYDLLQQANQQQDVINSGGPPYGLQFANNGQLQQRQQQQQLIAAAISGANNNPPRQYNVYGNNLGQQYDLFGGYPNDLDYTMCIRKESGFCSITYQLSRGEQGLQPFAVGHSLFGGLNESAIGSHSNWHPVSTECRDDYLLIGGVRLCSGVSSNQFNQQIPIVGNAGLPFDNTPSSIQFSQNGTILNSAGINQAGLNQAQLQHQLQNHYNSLMQQLTRLQQQQQQQQQVAGNVSYQTNNLTNNSGANIQTVAGQQQQQQQTGNINNNNSLEQQQAAILQQAMLIQHQLNILASNNNNNVNNFANNRYSSGQYPDAQGGVGGAIITDTTSGPFLLRFVSNMARNARGFQIDYRQNPCK